MDENETVEQLREFALKACLRAIIEVAPDCVSLPNASRQVIELCEAAGKLRLVSLDAGGWA